MAWTEFYMTTGGSNLNAGSTSGNSAAYTSTGGNWDGTSVFTPTDGATTSSSVSVGDWVSIYPTGNTITPYVAQVTAVGAGANGTITLSTTAKFGTAPTSNSGSRNAKAGGAWADLGLTASGGALNTGTVSQATRINVKAGTYASTTTSRTLGLAGTTVFPLWWRGYKNSIGDQDNNAAAVAGGGSPDIPSFTFTTGQLVSNGAHQVFSNIDVTGAQTTNGQFRITAAPVRLYRCRITCTGSNTNSQALSCVSTSTGSAFVLCRFSASTAAGACLGLNGNGPVYFHGCSVRGGTIGGNLGSIYNNFYYCIFDGQAGDGIQITNAAGTQIVNCTFYGQGGNGINITGTPSSAGALVANCHFEGITTAAKAAIMNSSGTAMNTIHVVAPSFYNCTANISGFGDAPIVYDNGTLAGSGLVNPGSHDFTPTGYLKGLGAPGAFENESYTGYLDVGAVQAAAAGGRFPHARLLGA